MRPGWRDAVHASRFTSRWLSTLRAFPFCPLTTTISICPSTPVIKRTELKTRKPGCPGLRVMPFAPIFSFPPALPALPALPCSRSRPERLTLASASMIPRPPYLTSPCPAPTLYLYIRPRCLSNVRTLLWTLRRVLAMCIYDPSRSPSFSRSLYPSLFVRVRVRVPPFRALYPTTCYDYRQSTGAVMWDGWDGTGGEGGHEAAPPVRLADGRAGSVVRRASRARGHPPSSPRPCSSSTGAGAPRAARAYCQVTGVDAVLCSIPSSLPPFLRVLALVPLPPAL